jgi:membrane-associated phospholipid phosphatase
VNRAALIGLLAVCAVLYTGLAVLAHLNHYFGVDLATTLAFQELRSTPLDSAMVVVSWPGYFPEFVPEFALILLAFWRLGLKLEAVFMTGAEIGVAAMGFILKPIVGRPRPTIGQIWVENYISHDPYSFTAGHVHTFTVIFGFIIYLAWTRMERGSLRRRVIIGGSVLFLLLEGFSRVYLGEHWLSDVLGAFLAGAIWLTIGILAYNWWQARTAGGTRRARSRPKAA